ncbi:type II secretion system protein GspD [Candidatus Poribacteria bacterium]|nr:type II secretion system protein GspD [Candidatus Poribacteria bacterium]
MRLKRFARRFMAARLGFFFLVCGAVLSVLPRPTAVFGQEEDPQALQEAEIRQEEEGADPGQGPESEPEETEEPKAEPKSKPVPATNKGASAGSTLVEVVFQEAKVEQVLQVLSNQAGVSITPLGKVPGQRVTIVAKNKELEEVLGTISQPKGWIWFKQADGGYGVADEAWYKQNELPLKVITKIFRPDHIQASELEKAIKPMLTQGISSMTADDRTNKLIVSDLPDVIERIERLIREIDVQLFTRVFYIRHADVNDISAKIEAYKSGPGTIEIDEKTHQIIVTDLLSNIKKMELLIDILDIGPEIVIYDVNNIGLDGADLEDLQQIIETIRTKDLLFEVNEKQGVFILEDVPEVHERVEQILEGFDRPVKQVLIQGEILTTSFTRDLGLGLKNAVFSGREFEAEPGSYGGGFSEILTDAPFAALAGKSVTAGYLGERALLEWQATFEDTSTQVLLQPRLLVKNQESSRIFVGSEQPFLSTFFNDNNSTTNRTTTQQTVTDGLTFEITPSISNSYLVEMELQIDNDKAQPVTRNAGTDDQVELIERDRQSVETVLTIPSGQTRVIGGLISTSDSKTESGVPFLSKIPYIGAFVFGTQSKKTSRNNLQLFITPSIVEDVIPRPTGENGRRGRLVTDYERVPGAFDMDYESEVAPAEGTEGGEESLLAPGKGDAASMIEELMRDDTPRKLSQKEADTNFIARPAGGSASIGEERPSGASRPRPGGGGTQGGGQAGGGTTGAGGGQGGQGGAGSGGGGGEVQDNPPDGEAETRYR